MRPGDTSAPAVTHDDTCKTDVSSRKSLSFQGVTDAMTHMTHFCPIYAQRACARGRKHMKRHKANNSANVSFVSSRLRIPI